MTRFLKRPAVLLLCLPALCLVCIGAARHLFGFAPSGAYPVLSTQTWKGTPPKYSMRPYQWLANGDLAYLEQTAQGDLQVCYQAMDAHGPRGMVRHGPLLPLSKAQLSHGVYFASSPDEQWIACWQIGSQRKVQTILHSADGRTTRTLPGEQFRGWLQDNRTFLTLTSTWPEVLNVHHLDAPQVETITGLSSHATPELLSPMPSGSNFLVGGWFAHLSSLDEPTYNYPNMRIE